MINSKKPGLSWEIGADHLHGVLTVERIRTDTLVQLVQHWMSDDQSREDVIAALDELAAVVSSAARDDGLDAAIAQIDDVAPMEAPYVEVPIPDVERLLAELTEVKRVTGRFRSRGASEIRHPAMAATRRHLAANPLPEQNSGGGS